MSDGGIKANLNQDELDLIYEGLEAIKPVPVDLFGKPVLNIADAGKMHEILKLLSKFQSEDDRYVPIN